MKLLFITLTVLASTSSAWATDPGAPVTQEQFKAWTDWAKKSVEVLDQRQKKMQADEQNAQQAAKTNPAPTPTNGGEQAVDLSAPSGASQATLGVAPQTERENKKMETYFDLNLVNQPGTTNSLAFDSYHNFVFFDITPTPDVTFSFNLLGPEIYPLYYELDYRATSALTLRAGKIWIAFDDISPLDPHTIFGGRENVKQLMPQNANGAENLYLPTIWTELGVAAKLMLIDTQPLQIQTDFGITNGFSEGGTDPVHPGNNYPNFSAYTPLGSSNFGDQSGGHRNKAFWARGHALFGGMLGVGISGYTGQWNDDGDPTGHHDLYILGFDAQLKLGIAELRAGVSSMAVQLPNDFTRRGGTYAEIAFPVAQRWKLLARGGTLQLDSRVNEATDMTVIGAEVLYNPGIVQFSLESNRNLKQESAVTENFTSYTDLRMIMLF